MTRPARLTLISAALFVVALAIMTVAYLRLRSAHVTLENEKAAICLSRTSRLSDLVSDGLDIRARTKVLADRFVSQLCLGTYAPVDLAGPDGCWVENGTDDCYRAAAKELLGLYRSHGW